MAYIGKKPEDIFRGNASYDSFTGDGSTTTFDVTNKLPDGGDFDTEVFVDNVRQEAGASKSYTIGQDGSGDLKRITFNVAPDDGSEIYVINPGRETSVVTVNDNTISTAKIQADAITGAKIADDAINSEHITDGSVDNVHLAGSIANAKLANSAITINGTAISLGASGEIVAGTDWQAVVVADGSTQLTAEAGKGYFLDTNAGVIEVFLPASPSRGDTIVLADYAGHFALNNVRIRTQGQLIDSVETAGSGIGYVLDTNNLVVELVYVDSSKGWFIQENEAKSSISAAEDTNAQFIAATGGTVSTVDTNFKVHVFTGDGNFVVSSSGNPAGSDTVDYLVVAGGGGGVHDRSGGGGAGGYREGKTGTNGTYTASPLASPVGVPVTAQTYPITVGGGGAGDNQSPHTTGNAGSNSVFANITSAGGGRGNRTPPTPSAPGAGGSGGGGGHSGCGSATGGAGNTPPVSPPQGNNGGDAGAQVSGGGGGATAVGQNGPGPKAGGAGASSEITGSSVTRAGGGGGIASGTGGSGGGGNGGADCSGGGGDNGTANTGGGAGGGGSNTDGGSGGKGVVIIRYKFQQ